jgi:hypothetical protein
MRKILAKIEAMLTAAAFAEEGDVETAREVMREAGSAERGSTDRPRPALRAGPRAPAVPRSSARLARPVRAASSGRSRA